MPIERRDEGVLVVMGSGDVLCMTCACSPNGGLGFTERWDGEAIVPGTPVPGRPRRVWIEFATSKDAVDLSLWAADVARRMAAAEGKSNGSVF